MLKSLGKRLPKIRHQLKKAVRVQQVMNLQGFNLALKKTFIGTTKKGFEYLGYCFNHQGITGLAPKTIFNFFTKLQRLYEQGATNQRLLQYINKWQLWCVSGLRVGCRGAFVCTYLYL